MKSKTTSTDRRLQDSGQVPDVPPTEVPGYELNRFIGSGAYGEVWVGIDQTTGRNVAIKFFARPGDLDGLALTREVEKLVSLSADRYVVQLLDVGWEATPPYYVMEYIPHGSLEDRLRDRGKIPVNEAIELFREIAIGLSHAHAKGIIHCDMKPANVLIDQDNRPRLADFGQARLMCERDPTLGTLYFMAPEQAEPSAMPDARWDVYGLGAVLYSMLTGAPPHRTDERVELLRSAKAVEERLKRYREQLNDLPPPGLHRDVPGIDRALSEIIDRCVAPDPERRFHSVDEVLRALDDRERSQARRPLLLLGLVGPLLLLLTSAIFGYRVYLRAMNESSELAKQGTAEASSWAAKSTAKLVANELDKRFAALQSVATDEGMIEHLKRTLANPELATLLDEAAKPPGPALAMETQRQGILSNKARQGLQAHIIGVLNNERLPYAASWFVTSGRGTMLAAAFHVEPKPVDYPVGRNFSYRTYFHGGPRDLPPSERVMAALSEANLSALFQSTASKTWKVAMSHPIRDDGETIGVVATTVELGDFVRFPTSADRCAMLVDGREGEHRGVVLQHPLFQQVLKDQQQLPPRFANVVIDVDRLTGQESVEYQDPLAGDSLGNDYAGRWIACAEPVQIERLVLANSGEDAVESDQFDTGLMLIVQQRLDTAIEPVVRLGSRLLKEGLAALAIILSVTCLLWWFVVQMLRSQKTQPMLGERSDLGEDDSMHSRETLPIP